MSKWRSLTPEELDVLDGLNRSIRFIEKQCEIPDAPPESREQRLEKALLFIRQWFNNLEDGTDDEDPLKAIRMRVHAPIHHAIDEALKP